MVVLINVVRTINGLETQAKNVEEEGHLSAARHMRNAAEMLRILSDEGVIVEPKQSSSNGIG